MNYQLIIDIKLKWQLRGKPQYKWSECKRLINTQTGREIKKVLNSGVVGYNVCGKFISLKKLRTETELIPKQEPLPF